MRQFLHPELVLYIWWCFGKKIDNWRVNIRHMNLFVEAALGFLCGMCLDTKWTQCPWKSQRSPTHYADLEEDREDLQERYKDSPTFCCSVARLCEILDDYRARGCRSDSVPQNPAEIYSSFCEKNFRRESQRISALNGALMSTACTVWCKFQACEGDFDRRVRKRIAIEITLLLMDYWRLRTVFTLRLTSYTTLSINLHARDSLFDGNRWKGATWMRLCHLSDRSAINREIFQVSKLPIIKFAITHVEIKLFVMIYVKLRIGKISLWSRKYLALINFSLFCKRKTRMHFTIRLKLSIFLLFRGCVNFLSWN